MRTKSLAPYLLSSKAQEVHSEESLKTPFFAKSKLSVAILLSSATLTSTAIAQDLEEVLVTATRREASLLNVPYNISAISKSQMEENRIGEINDLVQFVAGISFVNTGPSNRGRTNTMTMRGITADAVSNNGGFPVSTTAPISVYIGETPLFIPIQIRDIERVEVLRGPQGTLYGSGSLAGTIRFIPAKPDPSSYYAEITGDLASIAVDSGDFNYGTSGLINVPMGESSALRLAAGYQHWGGFIDMNTLVRFDDVSTANNSPIGIPTAANAEDINSAFSILPEKEDVNDADIWYLRASWFWAPSEKANVMLSYFRQEDDVDNIQAHFPDFAGGVTDHIPAGDNPYSPNTAGAFDYPTGGTQFPASKKYNLPRLLEEPSSRTTDLFSLDLEVDMGFASLTSSTSYYEDDQRAIVDVSHSIAQAFGAYYGFMPRLVDKDFTDNYQEGFVQEIRLVSTGDGQIEYVFGGFFQNVKRDDNTIQYIPGQTLYDSLAFGFHANPQLGDINFITSYESEFEDKALFGEITWRPNDDWQITAGLRAFWQDFDVDTFSQLPYCGIFCGDNEAGDTVVVGQQSINDQIFKLNSSYQLNSDTMLYATFSEGFRRGGANGIPLSGPFAASRELLLYQPDQSENFEFGVKGKFGKSSYTAAIYYIDWKNLQINDRSAAGGYGLVANGSEARSVGVELEVNGAIGNNFEYRFGYAHIDAEISDSFEVSDNFFGTFVPIVSTEKGDPLPNTSKNSLSVSLDYSMPQFLSGWDLRWHINGSYRSDVQSSLVSSIPTDPQPFTVEAFSVWDTSLNWTNDTDTVVSVYIDNIFDELALTGGNATRFAGPRGQSFFIGRPRTVGLRISYQFD